MSGGRTGSKIVDFYARRYMELAGYKKTEPCPPLREMLEYLREIPDLVYGLYGFRSEPLRGKIGKQEREQLIERCHMEGSFYAEELRKQFGRGGSLAIARKAGLDVRYPQIPTGGGRVLFAEFEEPGEIRIYQDVLERVEEMMRSEGVESMFEGISIVDVLAAHELFHYVEMRYKDSIFTLNYRKTLWRIGRFRYTSRLASLSEIAAMSFAKSLTGLEYSPCLFDVFLVYAYNREAGGSLYHEIRSLAETYFDDCEKR